MNEPPPNVCVDVDPSNPGQFFACCGLLELADRLWPGAMGWFADRKFCMAVGGSLAELLRALSAAELVQVDPDDNMSSAMRIERPFRPLLLNWWHDTYAGGKELKVWAGSMEAPRIARAMQHSLADERFHTPTLFDVGVIVYDVQNPETKVEPFYFDARRALNAHSRDVGFSQNDLQLLTTAFPAVELLCLIGLQRSLPATTNQSRMFRYCTWNEPLPPELLPAYVSATIATSSARIYEFESWYRTGQKKHKAFRSAVVIPKGG